MTLKERVRSLAKSKNISLTVLEEILGFGAGTISKWDKSTPNADKLNAVAKYFGVSMDYLLTGEENRENQVNSTSADEQNVCDDRDIARRIEQILKELKAYRHDLMFESEPLDDETRELLKVSLENSMLIVKINSKEEFTSAKDDKNK